MFEFPERYPVRVDVGDFFEFKGGFVGNSEPAAAAQK